VLGNWSFFSCEGCAAAPRLQSLNGCWEELPRPVADYAGQSFTRCPRTYLDARGAELAGRIGEGYLASLTPRERRTLPAKQLEALRYGEGYLMKFRQAEALT
jgi:hypothetical protein